MDFPQAQSETVIIAHGGYLHDFPILANCMKHNYDWTPLEGYMFVEIMQVIQNSGNKKHGLDALCKDLNMKRNRHSAIRRCLYIKSCLEQEIRSIQSWLYVSRHYITWIRNCCYQYIWCIIWLLVAHHIKN